MSWLAPLLCFSLIYRSFQKPLAAPFGWRGCFLLAAVVWGVLAALGTEILSLCHAFTFGYVLVFWILASGLAGFIVWKNNRREKPPALAFPKTFSGLDYAFLGSLAFILLIVALTALSSVPNNWDSLTYHMGRVVHWAQNNSVVHYPTHIMRQLWKAPWAEFTITHFYILAGSDRLANLVQWFSMLGSWIGVSLLAAQLGADRRGQLITTLAAATLPMGILQGSSTQNDYVTAFWLICFVNFILFFKTQNTDANLKKWTPLIVSAAGASLGLGILTKEITYIYALPFLFWFAFLLLKNCRRDSVKYGVLFFAILLILNAGHYQRNFGLYKKILAPTPDAADLRAAVFTPTALLSNVVRNIGSQLSTPFPAMNAAVDRAVENLHTRLRIDLTDPATTFGEYKFQIPNNPFHEDNAGNAVYILLSFACVILFLKQKLLAKKKNTPPGFCDTTKYFVSVTAAFLLLSFLFKWQPWGSRLLLPLNILYAPFIGLVLNRIKNENILWTVSFLLFLLSLPWIFYNEAHPLVGKKNSFNTERREQYFTNNPGFCYSYQQTAKAIRSRGCTDIGLFWSENSWEYPWWPLLAGDRKIRIEHVNIQNISAALPYPAGTFTPCAVIDDNSVESYKMQVGANTYVRSNMFAHVSLFVPDPDGTLAKKSMLLHFKRMLEYAQQANILHDEERKKIMIEPQKLEIIMGLKNKELKEARALDTAELNNLYPGLGQQVEDLKKGLALMLEGYKTADQNKYKKGQKLFFGWNIWFQEHKKTVIENFEKLQ